MGRGLSIHSYSFPRRGSLFAASGARLSCVMASGILSLVAAFVVVTIPYGRAIWDFMFVLDGAYRISLGQVPHVDFASPIGALTLYLTYAAQMLFAGGNAFVGLHVLMWLLLLPVMAALAPRFAGNAAFFAAFGLLALMVLLPMTLDSTHLSEISYFAVYNRFASGLLFLVGLWFVLPKSRSDWLLLAYVLLLLFFLKITAAAVAVGILLAAVVLGRCTVRCVAAACVSLAVGLIAVQAANGMVSAYLADVAGMSALNRGGAVYALFSACFRNWLPLAITAGLAMAALAAVARNAGRARPRFLAAVGTLFSQEAFAVDASLLVAAALFAESQNTGGLGLIAAAALFFHPAAWGVRKVATALLMGALCFPVFDMAVKRPLTALTREREPAPEQAVAELIPGTRVPLSTYEGSRLFARIATEWLPLARQVEAARFFLTPDPTTNAPAVQLAWATSAVEAAHVFQQHGYRDRASRYATLAFADPFAPLLRVEPATGVALVMHTGRTIPTFSVERARAYLASADGVFVGTCDISDGAVQPAFRSVLHSDFEQLPLTNCWDFYVRKGGN